MERISLSSENDQIIRPTFPNQRNISNDEGYNLQLLSVFKIRVSIMIFAFLLLFLTSLFPYVAIYPYRNIR